MGSGIAGLGLLSGVVALAMARDRGSRGPLARLPLVFAWVVSAILVVVVPDIRVVQNFAYLFFAYTGLWDGPLFFMLFCMAGGSLWAATAVSYGRCVRRACEHCGRSGSGKSSAPEARWGKWVTYAAAALALPYPVVRIAWALEIPLGVPAGFVEDSGLALKVGEAALGGLATGGAVLTLGLTRRWGEVLPAGSPTSRAGACRSGSPSSRPRRPPPWCPRWD